MCHYLLDTDEKRNCPVESCTHYITEKEYEKMKKQRIPAEVRERVIQAAREGVPYKAVAEQLGLSPQSVSRLAVEAGIIRNPERMKKSPETVSTPIEPASEEITDSGSSADTNIIPDVPENVKQEPPAVIQEEIPGVVVDALLEKLQNISEKIETEEKYLAALKADKKSLERWYHENCTAFGRDYKRRNNHAAK